MMLYYHAISVINVYNVKDIANKDSDIDIVIQTEKEKISKNI